MSANAPRAGLRCVVDTVGRVRPRPRPRPALAAGLALAAALAVAVPAHGQAPGTPPPLPAGGELRVADPAWAPGRTAGPVTAVTRPEEVLDTLLPAGERSRDEALARLARAGLVGGVAQALDGGPLAAPLRVVALQFAAPSGARQGLETVRWALRVRSATTTQTVLELPEPADGRLVVTGEASGALRTTAMVAIGGWLYMVDSPAPPGIAPDPEVTTLLVRLAVRQPERPDPAGAQPLGVTAELRTELGRVYAAARRRPVTAAPEPVAGSVQAARLGDTGWALARFAGIGSDPLLFRQPPGGAWTLVGDVGGAGCPRIPQPVRLVWGLDGRCPLSPSPVARPDDPDALSAADSPFRGLGTWVWEVGRSGGVPAIVRLATTNGIRTVFLKSGDGTRYWRQFDAAVGPLKAAGLKVCAWQYVYGRRPVQEARVAARAVRAGADCFVVDAESEYKGPYEGRTYRAARRYMAEFRRLAGRDHPVALTSFAYVDYHPRFPYSAFMDGPNGADVLMPQIYWGAFRTAVDRAVERTARWNAIYGAPIAPIAGTYRREAPRDLVRFRCLSAAYGWPGASYWSFQHTRASQWPSLARPVACGDATLARTYPSLRAGRQGDAVVWLQARLRAWGVAVPRTGHFRAQTRAAVRAFQRARGLQPDGVVGPLTWAVLLENPPARAASRARTARR